MIRLALIYMLANDFANAQEYYHKALLLNKDIRNFRADRREIICTWVRTMCRTDSVEKGLSYFTVSLLLADSLNMQKEKVDLLELYWLWLRTPGQA